MKLDPESKPRRRFGWLLFALALAGIGGIAASWLPNPGHRSASATPAIPAGVSLTSWFENGRGGQHVLGIARGDAPPLGANAVGTVLTDTDCDPDPQGINHCHNLIDFGNGSGIEVIHNHVMHRFPCLAPGQRLSVARLNADWVVASDLRVN